MTNIQKELLEDLKEQRDSITIGSASKGGAIKVYGDFNKPEEFEEKIKNAKRVKDFANAQIGIKL